MKKYLITGGAGFIGSHLADLLLRSGNKVTVIDNLSTGLYENIEHIEKDPNFRFEFGDILDEKKLFPVIAEADYVFHMAAAVGVKYIIENPIKSIHTNVKGTENVLAECNRKKIPVFIASTSEVYGKNTDIPLSEDDSRISGPTTVSRWSYACSKALDEFTALAYYKEKKLPVTIGRFFNTCGPRQLGDYGMVIPKFVKQALLNIPLSVYGDGEQIRCFSHVYDVVEAVYRLSEYKGAFGNVYNIGSTQKITVNELAQKVVNMTGSSSEIEYIPYEKVYGEDFEDMLVRQPCTDKLREAVGFSFERDIDIILEDIIKHFKE